MRTLLVEDDPSLAAMVAAGLSENQIRTRIAVDYDAALWAAGDNEFDLIILDVMLPGGSGFDLCAELRSRGVATPILMLTARDALDDRVRGLDAGADDYLIKPFAFRELLARVRALARRAPSILSPVYEVADLRVNLDTREVTREGQSIDLTAKEFSLLEFFVTHAGQVASRAAITAHVWDDNHDPFTNVLEVLIRRLRRKIDDPFETKLIHTLRGAGYRFGI